MANNRKIWESAIYTNAVDLAKKIEKLNELHVDYTIKIVDGIGVGEKVVRLDWDQEYINKRRVWTMLKINEAQKKLEQLEGV